MDVGVDLLEVKEDAGERGGEVEGGVGGVVGCRDEGVGEGLGGEGRGEEGFVVDVGGVGGGVSAVSSCSCSSFWGSCHGGWCWVLALSRCLVPVDVSLPFSLR